MKLNIVMISRAGSQKNIWDVCSESVESEGYKGDYMSNKVVFSLLVDNEAGVLSRVAGLFSRRGYNIDSVTVGITENPAYSRMTVAVSGDNASLSQIKKQLNKLEDVVEIVELEPGKSVCRELVLVKVRSDKDTRQDIMSIANIFRANIVDVSKGSMIIELTGATSKCEAFLGLLDGFEIIELVRTGLTGLVRGQRQD